MSEAERNRNAAFEALTECFVDLVDAKIDPKWLSRHLFTAKIITLDQLEEADSPSARGTEKERRQALLTIVIRRVKEDIQFFNGFLDALEDEPAYSIYVKRIKSSYSE